MEKQAVRATLPAMEIQTYIKEAKKRLRASGGRITPSREEALRLIFSTQKPLGANEIKDKLNSALAKPIDGATVFRMLNAFVESGLVHRLDESSSYIACKHFACSHGYHVVLSCRKCGGVEEIEMPEKIFEESRRFCAENHAFKLSDKHGQLEGVCKNCQ